MNAVPIGKYRFFQTIDPIYLLKSISIQSLSGCLQIFSSSETWKIFCQQGKVIYASQSELIFKIIYNKLNKNIMYKSNISSCISHYIRTYYENSIETKVGSNPDYEAIFWLIKSQYINHQEAKIFIENIILEVFKLLLKVYKGSYDFSPQLCLQEITHFYTWEVKYLVHSLLLNHNSKNNISGSYIVNDISRQQESRLTKAIDFIYKNKLSSDIKRKSSFSLTKGRKIYKIICIDDDPIILKTICNFLDEEIFNFIGIFDPLQALNKLIELQPDLILLDIEMPFLDGYELYSLLQKHPYLRNIPVVIITGRNGALDQAKARIIRVVDYLTKPFTQLDLVRSICHNLQYVDE